MNKENRVLGCGFERRKEACKVEADSLGVVVRIVYWLNTNVLQDGLVIGYFDNILFIRKQKLGQLRSGVINMGYFHTPGRIANEDLFWTIPLIELGQK